jgi:hypothetical protein
MGFHYRFNASGSHRWGKCWASKVLEKSAPRRPGGDAAMWGTAAHHLGEYCLKNGYNPIPEMEGIVIRIGADGDVVSMLSPPWHLPGFTGIRKGGDDCIKAGKGETIIKVDETMIGMVGSYTGIIHGIREKFRGCTIHPEVKLELTKDMGGTVDVVLKVPGRIIILDLKTGRKPVPALNNSQLALYALASIQGMKKTDIKELKFFLGIVQPALGGGMSIWKPTIEDLEVFEHEFFEARDLTLKHEHNPEKFPLAFNPGSHCEWCEAAAICPGMASQTMRLARRELNDLQPGKPLPPAHTLTDEKVLWVAEHAASIRDWLAAVEDYMAQSAIDGGKMWPGFKLVESQTKRRVIDKDQLEHFLMKNNFKNAFEPKIKAISKLEKIIPAEVLNGFIEKPVGALVLVPESDSRVSNKNMVAMMPPIEKGKTK